MTPEIKQQLLYNLLNSQLNMYPTPHFAIQPAFPAEFYSELKANLPADDDYTGIYALGRVSNYDNKPETRYVFSLRDHLDKLDENKRQFWQEIHDFFCSPGFVQNMVMKFIQPLVQQHGQDFLKSNFYPVVELFRDEDGYYIGPHTDVPQRVLNLFFYLPEDDSKEHLGTSFFVPREGNKVVDRTAHNKFEDFVKVNTAPYLPNSAAGFCRTDNSFHGVEPISEPGYKRYSLVFILRKQT